MGTGKANKTQRAAVRAAMLCIAAAGGCTNDLGPQAVQLLESGKAAVQAGDAAAGRRDLDAFLKDHSESRLAGEAYCYRAKARLALGDRAGARADFTQAAGLLQDKMLAAQSLLALCAMAEEDSDLPAAERMARQAVERLDLGQKPADEALWRLGCLLQKLGRWEEADTRLDRLIYLFPDTPQAHDATKRVRSTAWTIRLAVLPDRPAAAAEAQRLARQHGLAASVREDLVDGRLVFRVEADRYATYEQAVAALPAARARTPDAAVVPTR